MGATVTIAVAVAVLGYRIIALWPSARTQRALSRIVSDQDWQHIYQEQLRSGGAAQLKRELLELLRQLEHAVTDEAVEPLTRLCVLRKRDDIPWRIFRGLAAVMRQATQAELGALRLILTEALAKCPDDELVLVDNWPSGDGGWNVRVYGKNKGKQESVPMRRPAGSGELFHLLITHSVVRRVLPIQPSAGERVLISRAQATMMLELFG